MAGLIVLRVLRSTSAGESRLSHSASRPRLVITISAWRRPRPEDGRNQLLAEQSDEERTWSRTRAVSGAEINQRFGTALAQPSAAAAAAAQDKSLRVWAGTATVLLILFKPAAIRSIGALLIKGVAVALLWLPICLTEAGRTGQGARGNDADDSDET